MFWDSMTNENKFAAVVTVLFLLFAIWSVLESMRQERDEHGADGKGKV